MQPLPNDIDTLKAMVVSLTAERDAHRQCSESLASRHEDLVRRSLMAAEREAKLRAELLKLKKLCYGPRADRLTSIEAVDQMIMDFAAKTETIPVVPDDLPADENDAGADEGRKGRKGTQKRGRRDLRSADFSHVPERRVEHDLPDDQKKCPCCGEERCRVGSEQTVTLEYIPGTFERIVHVRHTYACGQCDSAGNGGQMTTADFGRGAKVFDRAMAGPGLLAFIASSKFSVYTPLYRLEDVFDRAGVPLTRNTMCVWMRRVAELLRPVYDLMTARVLESAVIQTDDTVMPMQATEKVKKARMWVYLGDKHNPYDVFAFTPSRSRDGPSTFLKNFTGTIVADAYGGYDGIVTSNSITRAGCWAHARRKFTDAQQTEPRVAETAVKLIGGLFGIEREIKDADADERTKARAERTAPLLGVIRSHLEVWRNELLPKSAMMEAVQYALNQWEPLCVFARDERVPIDNNASERDIKRIVLNRKNSLFVGNERGGETSAIIASLTATCRRHGIDPQTYLTQALVNVPHVKLSELPDWLPDRWKPLHAARVATVERGGDLP